MAPANEDIHGRASVCLRGWAVISSEVLVGLALAVAVIASAALSKATRIRSRVIWCFAGLVVSFVPGIAAVRLPPHVVFYGFLPSLLYAAAFLTAPREVRADWQSSTGVF
jgi:hypothetical protein